VAPSKELRPGAEKLNTANFAQTALSEVTLEKVIYPPMWKRDLRRAPNREGGGRMNREPVVVQESTRDWETWPDEEIAEKGLVYWKTLLSGNLTDSEALTMGIAKIPPNEALREHRHLQEEIYLVLEGTGSVTIDGATRPVGAGTSVFIPGNALHSCENTGEGDLRFAYVFAANSFEEVEYVFGE
jgi:mannose-6-phosphate isomerase-like protein (cupin superfamily)